MGRVSDSLLTLFYFCYSLLFDVQNKDVQNAGKVERVLHTRTHLEAQTRNCWQLFADFCSFSFDVVISIVTVCWRVAFFTSSSKENAGNCSFQHPVPYSVCLETMKRSPK